ncbi:diguanylate cyclase [Permianibacter sp. IMCC34836]|uniref:GGDEF domain-containing protein n=1 Tax=Permianibacter fluminis TaxID=2738515 RepID=UPI00155225AE|nr:diguanylate cyclase [Permianibacter fluminis]NQD36102.1 diguanylate cyclase [Permianibacter fluminis]
MTVPPQAPRLYRQLLLWLVGACWLCLVSGGLLSGLWLHRTLLAQTEPALQLLANRNEAAINQLLARQRDRVALLAARSELRQTLLSVADAKTETERRERQHRLSELLGDSVGTVPSLRYAMLLGPDNQLIASSDPALQLDSATLPRNPDPGNVAIVSTFTAAGGGSFHHRVDLVWAGSTLGSLHVDESATELQALLNDANPADNHFQLRLFAGTEPVLLFGPALSDDAELHTERKPALTGWTLQISIARSAVLQPLYQWLAALLLLAMLLTAASLLAGGSVARRLTRPLDSLAQYTAQWRVGTPWQLRLPTRSSAELQQLASALAQMAQRENSSQRALTEALLETQQVEEQFRRLFENSPVACLLTDSDGRIQLINPACASMFDYRVEQLLGENIRMLVPEASRSRHSAGMAKYFTAPREQLLGVTSDIYGLRRDGVELQIEVGVTPIRLGGVSLALATINDLSTRKAYEQALLAMSRTDGLTGIPNRRHFDQVIAEEWRRLRRNEQGSAILMIDIDHFKQLNDRYGHLVGDETLRMVGKALKQQLHRPGDFLARYGGEEFVVLLPDTDRDGAMLLAEQMRQAVAELPAANNDGTLALSDSWVTISVGVAAVQNCNEQEPADLLANADRLLYGAKRAGRNRVMA